VHAEIADREGRPVAGAEVDISHSSPEGLYENQDPKQAEMNLRGRFVTDDAGRFHFRSVKPAGYPIPNDGPVGELVRAPRRHHYCPSHPHFMIYKPGFKTMISQIYVPDDEHIDSDVTFGVTRALLGGLCAPRRTCRRAGFHGTSVFPQPALHLGAARSVPSHRAHLIEGVAGS